MKTFFKYIQRIFRQEHSFPVHEEDVCLVFLFCSTNDAYVISKYHLSIARWEGHSRQSYSGIPTSFYISNIRLSSISGTSELPGRPNVQMDDDRWSDTEYQFFISGSGRLSSKYLASIYQHNATVATNEINSCF